jgi:signal transduction histidine kinase
LGLFIANHIVQQHGGSIAIQSELQEGSRFDVCLPRKKCEHPKVNHAPQASCTLSL